MLPPGHAAAGYLVSAGVLSATGIALNTPFAQALLALGLILGALPDVDMFLAFAKTRSLVIENAKQSHRAYITHTPLFWLAVAVVVFAATREATIVMLVFLCPISHLFLDSLEDDIMWRWPFSSQPYRIFKSTHDLALPHQDFFSYWKKFLWWYVRNRTLTASLEFLMIAVFIASALCQGYPAVR